MRSAWLGSSVVAMTLIATPETARADAKQECIAAADRGQQLRDDGKYRLARDAFVACSRDACPGLVTKSCSQWLRDLDQSMPTVVIAVRDDKGNDVADVRVLVDGAALADKLDGKPLAVDPGEHVLRFERRGSVAIEQRVVVRTGDKNRAIAVTLRLEGASSTGVAHPEPAPAPAPAPADATLHGSSTARNVTALTLLGLAAGAAGAGIYFGLQSRSEADKAARYRATNPSNACVRSSSQMCQDWSDAVDAQNRDATLNTVFYVAGGALAVSAALAWFLWPRGEPRETRTGTAWIAPELAPGRASLRIGGTF